MLIVLALLQAVVCWALLWWWPVLQMADSLVMEPQCSRMLALQW